MWGENDTSASNSKDGANGEAHGFELSSTLAAVSRGMCGGTTCADTLISFISLCIRKVVLSHFYTGRESRLFDVKYAALFYH